MDFDEYQLRSAETAIYPSGMMGIFYLGLGLASEAGEVAGKIKKAIRDDNGEITPERRAHILDEMGDVVWYLSQLASELGESFETIAANNIMKLQGRLERGVITGSGDNR